MSPKLRTERSFDLQPLEDVSLMLSHKRGVMAGLVPAIHVFGRGTKDVDARDISAFTRVFGRAMPTHDGGDT